MQIIVEVLVDEVMRLLPVGTEYPMTYWYAVRIHAHAEVKALVRRPLLPRCLFASFDI